MDKDILIVLLVVPLAIAFWCALIFFIGTVGGWRKLSEEFPADMPMEGRRFRGRSVQISWGCNYGGCVTLTASPRGLGISVWPIFRMGHPPMCLPWGDIQVTPEKSWFGTFAVIRMRRGPSTTIRISESLLQEVFAAAGRTAPIA